MAPVAGQTKRSAWKVLGLALSNRKTVFMLLFGFAQGLPPALFLGTLYAWLSEADVDLDKGIAQGDKSVEGHGPFGELKSEGFRLENKGKLITFTGKARLIIYSEIGKSAP